MEEDLEAVILAGGSESDAEFIILDNILETEPVIYHVQEFDLNAMLPDEVKKNFRFEMKDIYRLADALHLPDVFKTKTRNHIDRITALCILLRRLSYPNRLADISPMFGLSPQSLSQIVNCTATMLIETYGGLLDNLQNLPWLNRDRVQYYAQAVHEKGGAIPNCWGFIDGTARAMCRPSLDQEEYYSGHKRYHCIKYQSVLCPDGLIVSIKGAYPGRRNDAWIFRESNLYQELEQIAVLNNEKYVLYGDQAYGVTELLLCPYPVRPFMPLYHQQFNRSMKILCTAVEWGFQKIISQFAFLDYKKNLKLLHQDLETMYKVSVILTNCHTCLYGSQTGQFFEREPVSLEVYLER